MLNTDIGFNNQKLAVRKEVYSSAKQTHTSSFL